MRNYAISARTSHLLQPITDGLAIRWQVGRVQPVDNDRILAKAAINKYLVHLLGIFASILLFCSYGFGSSINEVVDKYCQLDLQGARLSSSNNYDEIRRLMAWQENQDEPGWDCFLIISGYSILKELVNDNTATVSVKYDVLAMSCGDIMLIEKRNLSEIVDFNLVKVNNTWKIEKYIVYPRVSDNAAITHYRHVIKRLLIDEKKNREKVSNLRTLISEVERLRAEP